MKLYVINNNNEKIYINVDANSRRELYHHFGGPWFTIGDGYEYHVNGVFAEAESNDTATGAVLGGLIGLIGGPLGAIIGASVGGVVGNSTDQSENERVNQFNNSTL